MRPEQEGSLWLGGEDLRRSWKPWLRGAGIGFPFGALPAGGAEVPTFLSYATERRLTQAPGGVRRGGDRGRGRAGGGQQRVVLGHARAAADARHPDVGDGGDHARRLPDLQPPARAGAVREEQRAGVDADRVAVRRQRDAAGAQPAADPAVGEGARGAAGAALRRHPRVRHARRLLALGQHHRGARDVRDRRARVLHAPLRLPDRAGHPRRDPRAADGDPGAARARRLGRRLGRVRLPPADRSSCC